MSIGDPTPIRTERTAPFERADFANLSMGALAGPAGIEPTSPSSKHGILSIELRTDYLAEGLGIDPRITESKSVVIPFNYPPTKFGSSGRTRTDDRLRMKEVHWPLCYATILKYTEPQIV